MEVFNEVAPNKKLALALGYFDGIHIGHKKIIEMLVNNAKEKGVKSAVITFDKNPADYFNPAPTLNIQSFKDRQMILESLGVDYLYELNFEDVKDLSAIEYLKDILIKNFEPEIIIAGYNHNFGKDKSGDANFLKEFADKYNYECLIVPQKKFNDQEVSSTIIRKNIEQGYLNTVKALLGRSFYVRNSVIKGERVARQLGYPTANIIWPDTMVKLPYGVYFGHVQINSTLKPALISWGVKPTLSKKNEETLEAHIYDFSEDLYGKIVKIIFNEKLRDQEDFKNILVLKTQLKKDYEAFVKWAKLMKN